MIRNYFKLAWRNVVRNKSFSTINIMGLAIGMAATMLILLWVQDELHWDQFHPNHASIYQVMVNRNFNGEITTDKSVPFPLATALRSNFPEIRHSSVDDFGNKTVVKYKDKLIKQKVVTVSEEYLHLFQWPVTKGDMRTALSRPENIVLTEAAAKALFGTDDALGKVIRVNNNEDKTVSAVLKDIPAASSISFDMIVPFDLNDPGFRQATTDWVNAFSETMVEVKPGTDIKMLEKKISDLANGMGEKKAFVYFLHPMDKWRLYSDFKNGVNTGGLIAYVKLFTIIAIIILLIACVNFMNLSTAKSEKRAKEVGIRKTLGSERRQLIGQFYSESLIFSLIAYIVAVLSVYLLLPLFNGLIDKELQLNLADPVFIGLSIAIILLTGLVAGSYPALYLSSFNPIKVLKGTFLPGTSAALPRKVLVVLQFSISVLLISSTLLVYQQMQHVKSRDLGYKPDNLITITSSKDANKNAEIIKNELLQSNLVAAISRTSSPITEIWNFTPAPDWQGKPQNSNMIMSAMRADAGFAKTTGARLVAGRDFTDMPGDSTVMLLNSAAVTTMQLKEPVGMQMRYGNRTYTVIGVTDNVVMSSPFAPVMPMMVLLDKERGGFFQVRLKDGVQPRAALAIIEKVFKKYNPEYPFDYSFVDQEFSKKFVTEDLIGKLTNIFAGLAIFICCLGLSGLTAFTIERRFKEIGIRKILGASVQQVLYLISKEFLFLVLLAALISVPVTWYLLNHWLESYDYRITISIWLFLFSCSGVLLLTLLIVWLNAMKAALANPVKSLRTE